MSADWTVYVVLFSANRFGCVESAEAGVIRLQLEAGDTVRLDFGRSLDVAFGLRAGEIGPLPVGASVDLRTGVFHWHLSDAVAPEPVDLRFVAGARRRSVVVEPGVKSGCQRTVLARTNVEL
jgi:hypothetical protein